MKHITYDELVKKAKDFTRILVTGPQRSGTTFTGKELASVLGYRYIDEDEFEVHDLQKALTFFSQNKNIVMQAPSFVININDFANVNDSLIVFMQRKIKDIIRSQDRISWMQYEPIEKQKFIDAGYEYDYDLPISKIKYDFFANYIKGNYSNVIEMQYENMKKSPRWIDSFKRKSFLPKQTEK